MKTIQKKGVVCILGLLLSVFHLAGQKVITNHLSANGYPVIDLTELSPLHCLLTSTEVADRRRQINEQNPSNTAFLGVGSGVSSINGTWNTKMSPQYQVMRADHAVGMTDWASAYNACKQYSGEGGAAGEWRLPTYREELVLFALHPQLHGKGSFTAFNAYYYWSCTEEASDDTYAWHLIFSSGDTHSAPKTSGWRVRCIRDLK